jgi:protein gp37
MADAARHGTAGIWMKERARFTPAEVNEIRSARITGKKLADIAMQHGTTAKHISAICLGHKYVQPAIGYPLPNVMLGVSAENQQTADERIPILLQIPAAKRFVSVEPILGQVDLHIFKDYCGVDDPQGPTYLWRNKPDWVICGGETGPGARPMNPDWARSLRDQCRTAGVPFFFKQMSGKQTIPKDLMIREFPE